MLRISLLAIAVVFSWLPALAQLDKEYQYQQSGSRPRQRDSCSRKWPLAQYAKEADESRYKIYIDNEYNVWGVEDWRGTPVHESGRVNDFHCKMRGKMNKEFDLIPRRDWKHVKVYEVVKTLWKLEGGKLVLYNGYKDGRVFRYEYSLLR